MCIEMLRRLAATTLPVGVSGERQVDLVTVLDAAGLVTTRAAAADGRAMVVLAITPRGRAVLRQGSIVAFERKAPYRRRPGCTRH